ncbi:hypothetical protein [Pontibacter ruber]|uniref:DUF4625 domain-containing protein n=1 Tax=Pontibacter ruber TaxID=1343895 RepID=A0ABW5D204_9BACT|nr:hypothetical protein [Pontibacter ruber]
MKKLLHPLIFVLCLALLGCSKEDDTQIIVEKGATPIVDVIVPEGASVGEPLTMKVYFVVNNGCGRFKRFSESINGNIYTIAVHPYYVNGPCTLNVPVLEENYTFTPQAAGVYTFRFWQSNEKYLERSINVQ